MRTIISLCTVAIFTLSLTAAKVQFTVNNSTGDPIADIAISYGHDKDFSIIGVTNNEGILEAEIPEGDWEFQASKSNSSYIIPGTSPGKISFRTTNYGVRVVNSLGVQIPGVEVAFENDDHFESIGETDDNGDVSVELFPGTYVFRASKDHTSTQSTWTVSGCTSSATITFQTAFYGIHVEKHDGADLANVGITYAKDGVEFYPIGLTDEKGKSGIELFAGTYKFKADLNGTEAVGTLSLPLGGKSGRLLFRTEREVSGEEEFAGQGPHHKVAYGRGDEFYVSPEEVNIFDINLLHFTVKHNSDGNNDIHWVTKGEMGHSYFTLEMSMDGVVFSPLKQVFTEGNSVRIKTYEETHNLGEQSPMYYRLKQTFHNGEVKYSRVINTELEGDFKIQAYPNPTNGKLFVELEEAIDAVITIYDANGSLVHHSTVSEMSTTLDMTNYAKGLYFVNVHTIKGKSIFKINKY